MDDGCQSAVAISRRAFTCSGHRKVGGYFWLGLNRSFITDHRIIIIIV